jgi:hypothetical protein
MNEQFTRQAQEMFNAAKDGRIPDNIQAMAEDNVAKAREAYQKMNSAAKDGAKVVEDVFSSAQASVKTIGEKVLHNTVANTEAAFDAAQAIARARSIPEAARLHTIAHEGLHICTPTPFIPSTIFSYRRFGKWVCQR